MTRLTTAALALIPTAALAHSGDHGQVSAVHALTAPDHLAALVALVVVVGILAYALARR